ncbi:hypothetical protein HMI54_002130 [Coelomomyces lativittatus]|nr:hypothetical protein HMI56_002723 [Coelomomyces lativittatus]KAJ1517473.1 hypothetical protein HMI55_006976 [Coelomomyces lativittatus]KAJ1518195.1 hypothetical protein HMI54_002130 [Coelomomyces lativittatus]
MPQNSFLESLELENQELEKLEKIENFEDLKDLEENRINGDHNDVQKADSQNLINDFEKTAQIEQEKLLEVYERENQDLSTKERSSRMAALSHLLEQSAIWASIIADKFSKDKEAKLKEELNLSSKKNKIVNETTSLPRKRPKRSSNSLLNESEPGSPTKTTLDIANDVKGRLSFSDYFHGTLADYQKEGIQWLDTLYSNGLNGILADEMGLGKTVQAIGFLCHLMQNDVWGYFLVLAPLSTLTHWEMEFSKFAPSLPILVYHGDKKERKELQKSILRPMPYKEKPVIITSYEMAVLDATFFQKIPFRFMVVDEGHRLKNYQCVLLKILKSLNSENRILLTGTPLQNDLGELWSLLNFLVPDIFNDVENFLSWFDFEITGNKLNKRKILSRQLTDNMVTKIHKILSPFMLRRIKTDVNLNLPSKKELIIYTPMTQEQKELYMAIKQKRAEEYFKKLFSNYGIPPPRNFGNTSSHIVMAARRSCCHPFLFPHPLYSHAEEEPEWAGLVTCSGKMRLLDKLLPPLMKKYKIILFSQFTTMLDLLADYLDYRGWKHARIDGRIHHLERRKAIQTFNTSEDTRFFLSSTRAGGLGINLSVANIVILFDSDWNPQQDLQAQDRAHRIGQTLPVTIFRLVSEHSFENQMVERAQAKRQLEKMIIGQGHFHSPMDATNPSDEKDPTHFLRTLEKLLEENDGEKIHVLKEGEEVISDEALQRLLDECEG